VVPIVFTITVIHYANNDWSKNDLHEWGLAAPARRLPASVGS